MNLDLKLSCDDFNPSDTSSSLKIGIDYPCLKAKPSRAESQSKSASHSFEQKCPSTILTSSSSTISSDIFDKDCRIPKVAQADAPNIGYELGMAKSTLQQFSTISGDNLFDHLSDIIKRIIDERPPNVIDFFEEFSRNVREQKLHLPERFPPDAVYEESRHYKVAKKQLISMKLPYTDDYNTQVADEDLEEERHNTDDLKLELKQEPLLPIFRTFYDRVQHLQFFWNQCGFSITYEDIFQLACSMNRLQTHPSIRQCRFWGMLNGLKASYYVVEAYLSNEEIESRAVLMQKEMLEMQKQWQKEVKPPPHIGPELTPGAVGWDNYPFGELQKMKPDVLPVPLVRQEEVFDIPPEPIGSGVNRYSYFVVNSLSDDWLELPICTPKQIKVSRQIKKFLTGDLEADVVSYPCFPGQEKHYLRALISRITAGTYIAPKGYYRKMTKREKRLFDGIDFDEMEEEEDDEEEETLMGEGEEEEDRYGADNDIVLLKNERYEAQPLNTLNHASKWRHVRPNILQQGRVVWFDEEKARREREKELQRLEKLRLFEEMGIEEHEEEEEDENEDEGEEEEEETMEGAMREIGPSILAPCSRDTNEEAHIPWVGRFTSKYTNRNERILIMKSNIWPGAFTFVYEKLCESIYLGWGHKYISRNMAWHHMPPIAEEFLHGPLDFIETTDPSVEMEEAYRLNLLKKELKITDIGEHLTDYEDETPKSGDRKTDYDDDDDDDDDEEEEEEEEEEE